MVDLTKLSQEQQWGLAYVVQVANAALPEDGTPVTVQEYADRLLASACDSYYKQLIDYKTQMAIALFNAQTPERQAELVEELSIPDVLQ